MRHITFTALLALCTLAGCNKPKEKSGIVNLRVRDYVALGSATPLLVEHDGHLHSFWRGDVEKQTKQIDGLPMIPKELMRGSWKTGWNTVAYANRLDGGRWSAATRLADGDVQCDPKFVWSDSRGLNLLVGLGDSTCSHLLLSEEQKTWHQIRHFPELKEASFVPLGIQQRGNSLHVTTFSRKELCYWRYDGRDWHGPLVIEEEVRFDGVWGYFGPRLAITDGGDVHVVWNTQGDPSHVVIRDDTVVSKAAIQLTPRANKGNDIDIEALPDGRLILAYQVDDEAPQAYNFAIYFCSFTTGRWGAASACPSGGGLVLGDPQLIAHQNETLLVWRHSGEVQSGGSVASGSTASFSVRSAAGVWTQPTAVKPISTNPLMDMSDSPAFYSLYCTTRGDVYMTWGGDDSIYITSLAKLAGEPAQVEQVGADQHATRPESKSEGDDESQPGSEAHHR